ncbi:hypothetical protein Tco_1417075 [Tanacetum coccineum]
MSSSSTVTYTSVYTDYEPGRVFWGANEELSDGGSLRVIIYGYDRLPMQPIAPPSPDYVPGPEHPPSPNYVPGPEYPPSLIEVPYVPEPEYPEYLVPSDAEAPLEDQPLPADASPTALSSGYVADSDPDEDPKEDPEEDHADYPTDRGDGDDEPSDDDDDDDDTDDKDEEPFEDEDNDEEEEHLALADSSAIHVVDPVPSAGDIVAFETDESAPTPRSPQTKIPSPPLPPLPSSLHLPPPVPTSLLLPSSPLLPLPASLFIPPPVDHREDIPEVELPPHKRLCLTAPISRFIDTMDDEIRHQRAEEVGYGIRDVWVDPSEAVEEDRKTQLFQRVDGLVEDRQFYYETTRLLDQEALVSREAWAHSVGLSSEVHYELQAYRTHTQNNMPPRRTFAATARVVVAATRVATAAAAAAPMTAAAVEQLIEARESAVLANHETLRNSTNGHGDGSHNYDTRNGGTVRTSCECTYKDFLNCKPLTFKGTEGVVVLSQWFEKMESVFHISNCAVENQVKFATCTLLGNALTWWNFHMKTITQDVAYAMDWKALNKMMTVKYCPRGEIKKLEIEL